MRLIRDDATVKLTRSMIWLQKARGTEISTLRHQYMDWIEKDLQLLLSSIEMNGIATPEPEDDQSNDERSELDFS